MTDSLTPEQRRTNMQHIHNKDSEIEIIFRKELWRRGLRYRKNVKSITGCPDIAFKGIKIAVFCDSEFWYGYDWENRKFDIKSNCEFWINKIERNIMRDKEVNRSFESDRWQVLRFWGKDIKKNLLECADAIERSVKERRKCLTKR